MNAGRLRSLEGQPAEAEALLRQSVDMYRRKLGNDHPTIANSLASLGTFLAAQNRCREAEPLLREALSLRERAFPPGHYRTVEVQTKLAACASRS